MIKVTNVKILKKVIKSIYEVACRRTSKKFSVAILNIIVRTLEEKFDFLKYVRLNIGIDSENIVYVDSDINYVDPIRVGRAIETIIQVVYMDLKENAGLYFIKELIKSAGKDVITALKNVGVDLELLEIQQRFIFRQRNRIKTVDGNKDSKEKSLLNYSWEEVSSWNYDFKSEVCVIYDKDGEQLDILNLKEVIKGYINDLTGEGTIEEYTDYKRKDKQKKV
jgi:hypothetical protein